jgi:hypothetical protein
MWAGFLSILNTVADDTLICSQKSNECITNPAANSLDISYK